MPSATSWIGPRECHTEWSKSGREREIYDMLYERNLKIKDTNELTHNPEKDSQTYKINLWLLGAKDS